MFSNTTTFSKESTKMMFVLLSFAILGYTTFLIFRETKNMRSEIKKIKKELSDITEALERPVILSESETEDLDISQETHVVSRLPGQGHGPAYTPPGLKTLGNSENIQYITDDHETVDTQSVSNSDSLYEGSISQASAIETNDDPVLQDQDPMLFIKQELETCSYVFKTGKKKGERCTTVTTNELCRQHSKQKEKSKKIIQDDSQNTIDDLE